MRGGQGLNWISVLWLSLAESISSYIDRGAAAGAANKRDLFFSLFSKAGGYSSMSPTVEHMLLLTEDAKPPRSSQNKDTRRNQ